MKTLPRNTANLMRIENLTNKLIINYKEIHTVLGLVSFKFHSAEILWFMKS
jgi:hypothetical protein